ncbi:MAG TPA: Smr/MutS family protein [Candidatus Polarisedimenticolaceae bacterium]|nr:Smr/MutS family protein [Candidatus Polarisedimenticolaceae bacterium]
MPEIHPPFGEPVILPIGDILDLHSFEPKDISSVVEEYLEECRRSGLLQVRLIHGKGAGVQRAIIRSLLIKNSNVLSFEDAPAEAGGWGATIVRLLV